MIFPDDAKKPNKPIGVVHGTSITNNGQSPKYCTKQPQHTQATGVKKNGTANIAFITIGIPKIIGSLILKIPQGIDNLAIALKSSLLEKSIIAMIKPIVIPEPVGPNHPEANGLAIIEYLEPAV